MPAHAAASPAPSRSTSCSAPSAWSTTSRWHSASGSGSSRRFWRPLGKDQALFDEAFALLGDLGLAGQALQPIATLPYGRQRLVEIALALAARPKVLLLDEPAAGVPAAESHLILDAIAALPAEIAVLIVEHDMDVVFRFASASRSWRAARS